MKALQVGELLALPIQSAIRAQNLALQETVSLLEQFGLEEGAVRTFRVRAERVIEERTVDRETGEAETRSKIQPFEVSVPLLAMVSPPSLHLQEMNVEFGLEIVEPRTEPIALRAAISPAVLGPSLAASRALFATLGQSNPTTMKVNMKIVREVPEGMARLGDILVGLLSGQEVVPVDSVPGIDRRMAGTLRERGIMTATDLASAGETPERRRELAEALGVPEELVVAWRDEARRLTRGEG